MNFSHRSCFSLLAAVLVLAIFGGSLVRAETPAAAADTSAAEAERRNGAAHGEKTARELIARGQVYLQFHWGKLIGETSPIDDVTPNFAEHLRTAYGIDCRDLGTWPRTDFERASAAAFNRVTLAHLEQKHGAGFIHQAEETAAYAQGKIDAAKELAAGMLALETMGLPPVSRGAYMDILKTRHGIQLRAVAGCIVSSSITGHARGFNEVMIAEIAKRFGPDALAQVEASAERIVRAKFETPEPNAHGENATLSLIASVELPPSSTPITAEMEIEQRKLFAEWLEERTPRYFTITAQRLFTAKLDTFAWGALAESVGIALKKTHPTALDDTSWRHPDYFAVRGWRLPEKPGFALVVSALGELPEKKAYLVGLYEIALPPPQP